MRRLLTGYAVSFNKRHKRSGHLFQNLYKSILCEEEPYFLELVLGFFLVRELRMSATKVAESPGIGRPAVSSAAKRGETIVREKGYGIV